jgi:hypothetical protein
MTDIKGFAVPAEGTYVLMADVVQALREYAESVDSLAVREAAEWLAGGLPEPAMVETEVFGAEADDNTNGVARVEVYPDPPEDPHPKWYARTVDTGGYIIKTTGGSFDQEWVIKNAQERWPGKEIFLLQHAGEDSKWQEDSTRNVFPSMGPPVRRLFAGVSTYQREEGAMSSSPYKEVEA